MIVCVSSYLAQWLKHGMCSINISTWCFLISEWRDEALCMRPVSRKSTLTSHSYLIHRRPLWQGALWWSEDPSSRGARVACLPLPSPHPGLVLLTWKHAIENSDTDCICVYTCDWYGFLLLSSIFIIIDHQYTYRVFLRWPFENRTLRKAVLLTRKESNVVIRAQTYNIKVAKFLQF